MTGQAGVADPGDSRVIGEPVGQVGGAALSLLQSQGQGAQAAQHEEGFQRAGDRAGHLPATAQLLAELRAPGNGEAEEQVGVATEELGRAVHRDVCAKGDRLLQQWCGEGVVDRDQSADVPRRRAQSRQIGDVQQRVGRRFQPDEIRAPGRGYGDGGVGNVDQLDVPASLPLTVCQ